MRFVSYLLLIAFCKKLPGIFLHIAQREKKGKKQQRQSDEFGESLPGFLLRSSMFLMDLKTPKIHRTFVN